MIFDPSGTTPIRLRLALPSPAASTGILKGEDPEDASTLLIVRALLLEGTAGFIRRTEHMGLRGEDPEAASTSLIVRESSLPLSHEVALIF